MSTRWHLWKWWNKTIFEEKFQRSDNHTSIIQKFTRNIDDCTRNYFVDGLWAHRNNLY